MIIPLSIYKGVSQFHQHVYTQLLHVQMLWHLTSISETIYHYT